MTQIGHLVRRHFEPLVLSAQVAVDLLVVLLACWCGYELGETISGGYGGRVPPMEVMWQLWALTAAVCLVCFHAFGMYSPVKSLLNVEEFKAVAKGTALSFLVLFTLIVLLRSSAPRPGETTGMLGALTWLHSKFDVGANGRLNPDAVPRIATVLSFAFVLVFTTASRFLSFKVIQGLHRHGIGNRNVLIFGSGDTGRWLQRKFLLTPTLGMRMVGFVSEDPDEVGRVIERRQVLGTFEDLERLIAEHKVHEVFIAMPEADEERVMEVIEAVERAGPMFRMVPRFYHLMAQHVRIENMDSIPLISRPDRRINLATALAKRSLDVLVSSLVLLLLAPVFLLTAFLIKRDSKGPVFFRQVRIGQNGRPFTMFKFRTMYTHLSGDAVKPTDAEDPRITPVGRVLRRYSLDELPQFLNVLGGSMSVVGPRPEMPFIVQQYGSLQRERLRAKPGITGLWQISYHRTEAIHENLDYDVYYVENQSLLLDVVIMALTVVAVVKGTGAH